MPTKDWFDAEEDLNLWNIERHAIRRALPVAANGQSLLIGPAANDHDMLKGLAFGQHWYFDTTRIAANPWYMNDISCLPIQDECMDLVVLRHCMNTDEKSRHLLFDVCRLLKPGGHIVLTCLNASAWTAARLRRRRQLRGLTTGWIKSASDQTGLKLEFIRSFGLGGISRRYFSRPLPPLLAAFSNLHVCVLSRQPAGGEIRRLVFRLPRRGRSVAADTGVFSKTGT